MRNVIIDYSRELGVHRYASGYRKMTRTQFEHDLEELRNQLTRMGNDADRMLATAIQSLVDLDLNLAEEVILADDNMDRLDLEIETDCMKILALQQPIARDLRLVGTALKVITDLERIGDHAVDIAKVSRKLINQELRPLRIDLPRMAGKVRSMLKDSLTAFINHDLGLVQQVIEADDEVDDIFHDIRSELHNLMRKNPDSVVTGSYLLFVAHYLERVADHAVNIAERVAYIETGNLTQFARRYED